MKNSYLEYLLLTPACFNHFGQFKQMIMYIFKINFMITYTVKRVEFKMRYNKSRIGIIVRLNFDKSARISNTSSSTLPAVSPVKLSSIAFK